MKRLTYTAALVILPVVSWASDRMEFTGTARQDNGNILYTETHTVTGTCSGGRFTPNTQYVEYRRSAETGSFAGKQLRYDRSLLRPAVEFRQPDFSETLEIRYPEPNRLRIDWNMPGEPSNSAKDVQSFELPYSDNVVVDTGFDHLVRKHWQSVQKGLPVEFEFLAPTRGETFSFVMEPATVNGVNAEHVVRIRPSGVLLRFVVDPIILGYNDQGFLTDYVGLTNIRKGRDKNHTAHIRYRLSQAPACDLLN